MTIKLVWACQACAPECAKAGVRAYMHVFPDAERACEVSLVCYQSANMGKRGFWVEATEA